MYKYFFSKFFKKERDLVEQEKARNKSKIQKEKGYIKKNGLNPLEDELLSEYDQLNNDLE